MTDRPVLEAVGEVPWVTAKADGEEVIIKIRGKGNICLSIDGARRLFWDLDLAITDAVRASCAPITAPPEDR